MNKRPINKGGKAHVENCCLKVKVDRIALKTNQRVLGSKMKSKSSNVEQRRRRKQKKEPVVRSNPFELRINKQKFSILGRKTKNDKGLPGLSRSKAIKKVSFRVVVYNWREAALLLDFRKSYLLHATAL